MYFKTIAFCSIVFMISMNAFSQDIKPCATDEMFHQFLENNPSQRAEVLKAKADLESRALFYQKHKITNKSKSLYIIPVVFHVLHQNGPENISDEQIKDAVRVINEDFRKMNADTSSIRSAFSGIAADTRIEVRLAKFDPNGNCTNGIDRIFSPKTNNASDASKLNQWPRDKYLNIWVVASIGSGAAGYAYYPHATVGNNYYKDGIVILSHYVGSIGTANRYRSRSLTHEIGHYLNLAHTWGSTNSPGDPGNCMTDDGVLDTPPTLGHTTCDLNAKTCDGTLDNVQNYMEYSYCSNMFTNGQAARMHSTLDASVAGRNNLHSQQNLIATGVIGPGIVCEVDFESEHQFACVNDTMVFWDKSYHNPQDWTWNLQGANPQFYYDSVINVTYPSPGIFDVTLTVSDSTVVKSKTKNNYIYIFDSLANYSGSYAQGFENKQLPQEWLFMKNKYGDSFEKAATGNRSTGSIMADNYGDAHDVETYSIISPSFNLSQIKNPKLYFSYAFATIESENTDVFEIFTSGDCGRTWNQIFSYPGSLLATAKFVFFPFVPDSSQWNEVILPFSQTAKNSQNLLIKFQLTTGGGNNFYLDNIQIGEPVGLSENQIDLNSSLYPNPVGERAFLNLFLPNSEEINIDLFNSQGKMIKELYHGKMKAGKNFLDFNTEELATGIFLVRILVSGEAHTIKLIKN